MFRKVLTGLSLLCIPLLSISAYISPEAARQLALHFFQERCVSMSGIAGSLPEPVLIPRYSDGELTCFQVEIPDMGFVIVAGDDRCTPVLAWSREPLDKDADVPEPVGAWFDWVDSQVSFVRQNNIEASNEIISLWETYLSPDFQSGKEKVDTGVGPLTTSNWGQRYYYNTMCPEDPEGPGGHAIAGCVATAMAQVLFYYRYPLHGEGSNGYMSEYGYEYVNYEEAEYRWDEMVNQVYGMQNPEVAELIYHAGVSVDMNYGPAASGATTEEAVDALRDFFKYDDKIKYIGKYDLGEAFRDSVIDNLNRNLVVLYRGGGLASAHSFVCDGYQDSTWFHFNWGWEGNYNGYFTMENLNPASYDFTFDQGAIINIYPREDYPGYCQGGSSLTAPRGTFVDGSGPESYPAGLSCSWLISPANPDVTNVMLWFTQFAAGENTDWVYVYDGPTQNDPLLGEFTGNGIPPMIVSSGSEVLVVFESDDMGDDQGWQAEYLAYSGPFCNPFSQFDARTLNYFTDGSGPYPYTDLSDCGWLISPQTDEFDSIASVHLYFHSLDLSQGDTLFIYGGSDNAAPLLGKLSGSALPGDIFAATNNLYLNFISDGTTPGSGWAAGYTSDLPVFCSDTVLHTAKTGVIEDGSGNKKYVPDSNCSWNIVTDNTEVITFEFLEFDLEFGYDQLKFYDAAVEPPELRATYWGHELPGMLSLETDNVLVTFISDESVQYTGWKIKYTALAPGIQESDLAGPVIYPNPARERIFVEMPGKEGRGLDYILYDAQMSMLSRGRVLRNEDKTGIDISGLAGGIYIIVFTGEDRVFFSKFIVL